MLLILASSTINFPFITSNFLPTEADHRPYFYIKVDLIAYLVSLIVFDKRFSHFWPFRNNSVVFPLFAASYHGRGWLHFGQNQSAWQPCQIPGCLFSFPEVNDEKNQYVLRLYSASGIHGIDIYGSFRLFDIEWRNSMVLWISTLFSHFHTLWHLYFLAYKVV